MGMKMKKYLFKSKISENATISSLIFEKGGKNKCISIAYIIVKATT